MPLPPMTASVKAILATLIADVVGLRCRPLISAIGPFSCAREVSCRVRAGEVARPGREYGIGFTPRSRKRPLVLVGGPVGPPPPSMLFVVCPYPTDGARREGSGRAGRFLSTSLGQDRNGSLRSRHLLPTLALLVAANPNSVLNAQEIRAFSQVQTVLNPAVASS